MHLIYGTVYMIHMMIQIFKRLSTLTSYTQLDTSTLNLDLLFKMDNILQACKFKERETLDRIQT
jgi:hypothetical protein